MDEDGALLGLLLGVLADLDEGIDDVIEGVEVIIENNKGENLGVLNNRLYFL
jgi:hypothetical protein